MEFLLSSSSTTTIHIHIIIPSELYSMGEMLAAATPFLLVIFLQFAQAGMSIIGKYALNMGMDQHVFIVYRHIFASAAIAPFALLLERLD